MYTRIESRFWQDEKMRAVSDDARYLMLYLLTSPHRNILGFYFLPSPYACFDLGWDEKRFKKALQELLQIGRIKYDAQAHVVLVQNYLKHNPLENPNQVKSAIERLEEMPQTPLFQDFLAVVEQFDKPFMKPLVERLRERLQKQGTGTGTGDIYLNTCASDDARTGNETQNKTQSDGKNGRAAGQDPGPNKPGEQRAKTPLEGASSGSIEAETVTATGEKRPNKPRPPFTSKKQEAMFDQFWQAYPKKRSKGRAEKIWVKLRPNDDLFAAILAGLERAKASYDWTKEGGKYIPYPSTWLNAKGWEDEYQLMSTEVKNNAKPQGNYAGPVTARGAKPQKNRFAGLARDGGTGHIIGH